MPNLHQLPHFSKPYAQGIMQDRTGRKLQNLIKINFWEILYLPVRLPLKRNFTVGHVMSISLVLLIVW